MSEELGGENTNGNGFLTWVHQQQPKMMKRRRNPPAEQSLSFWLSIFNGCFIGLSAYKESYSDLENDKLGFGRSAHQIHWFSVFLFDGAPINGFVNERGGGSDEEWCLSHWICFGNFIGSIRLRSLWKTELSLHQRGAKMEKNKKHQ